MQPKAILGTKQENIHSSQNSRKLISSSVKTPALLFYKPASGQKVSREEHGASQQVRAGHASNFAC